MADFYIERLRDSLLLISRMKKDIYGSFQAPTKDLRQCGTPQQTLLTALHAFLSHTKDFHQVYILVRQTTLFLFLGEGGGGGWNVSREQICMEKQAYWRGAQKSYTKRVLCEKKSRV